MTLKLKSFEDLINKTSKWSTLDIKNALDLINKTKDLFYNSDIISIPDFMYDKLADRYELETGEKIKAGVKPNSREGIISFQHTAQNLLGTLEKIKHDEEDELFNFISKLTAVNTKKTTNLSLSQKVDGNSLAFSFNPHTGELAHVFTRGEEGKGVELTHHFKKVGGYDIEPFEMIPELLPDELVTFKFEACCLWDKFSEVDGYKNPRAYVSGQLGRLDLHKVLESNIIDFIMLGDGKSSTGHNLIFEDFEELFTLHPKYKAIKRQYVSVLRNDIPLAVKTILSIADKMFKAKTNYTENDSELVYNVMTDGMVIECLDTPVIETLGWNTDFPNYARAYKFKPMEAITTLIDIRFDFGSATSRYTPVAIFEPVILNGNTYEHVSLANYARFMELQPLGKGSKVLFTLVNDTLGYLDKLDIEENKNIEPIEFIENCKHCGYELYTNDNATFVYCKNKACEGTLSGRIFTYITKIGVKNIGKATIDLICEHLNVRYPHELYSLTKDQLEKLPRMGTKSAENFLNELNTIKVVKDYDFFNAASIEGVGSDTFRKLFSVISAEKIMELGYSIILNEGNTPLDFIQSIKEAKPEDIADKTINKLLEFFTSNDNYDNYIIPLLEILEVTTTEVSKKSDNFIAYNFCVTGSTVKYPRQILINMLKEMGHKVTGGVTSKTDYLINNDINSSSGKNVDAKKLSKPIITEDELYKLLKI